MMTRGRTREKGNTEKIRGPPSDQVRITDDYGAYDTLFENHALCWVHPPRKFRDLATASALSPTYHTQCLNFYEKFHGLKRAVALTIAAPLSSQERAEAVLRFRPQIDT